MSFSAHAGMFGPSESDVVITTLPPGECKGVSVGFKFENRSHTPVNKISFYIYGKEDGHSTEYDLTDWTPIDLDDIMKPGAVAKKCFDLKHARWPDNKSLRFFAKISSVDFSE